MSEFDFEKELSAWIKRIMANSSISTEIIALNFGLFESSENMYVIYLIGSKKYDSENNDWACTSDFVPKERYFHIKSQEISGITWERFLKLTSETLSKILSSDITKDDFFSHIKDITTGFDDGDLLELKFR